MENLTVPSNCGSIPHLAQTQYCVNLNSKQMENLRNIEAYKTIVKKYGKDFMKSYEYLSSSSKDRLKIKIVCNKLIN